MPFKIALANEYASTLTIGKDASNSFDKSQVDVNLGESEFTQIRPTLLTVKELLKKSL